MLNRLIRRVRTAIAASEMMAAPEPPDAIEEPPVRPVTGAYALLYKYLKERYANTVVLTFAEIEDLVGFHLPDQAGQPDWWTANAAAPSTHSEAWTRANRTASPNLLARTVAFARPA
jgi:hypothetical protein